MKKKFNIDDLHDIYEQRTATIKILNAIKNDKAMICKFRKHDTEDKFIINDDDFHTFNDITKGLLIETYEKRVKLYDNEILKIIGERKGDLHLFDLVDEDYEIIQPKPILTEDENIFAKLAYNQGYRYLTKNKQEKVASITKDKPIRCSDGTWIIESIGEFYFYLNMFSNLFQFIKWEDEPYSIEELLKE